MYIGIGGEEHPCSHFQKTEGRRRRKRKREVGGKSSNGQWEALTEQRRTHPLTQKPKRKERNSCAKAKSQTTTTTTKRKLAEGGGGLCVPAQREPCERHTALFRGVTTSHKQRQKNNRPLHSRFPFRTKTYTNTTSNRKREREKKRKGR